MGHYSPNAARRLNQTDCKETKKEKRKEKKEKEVQGVKAVGYRVRKGMGVAYVNNKGKLSQ